MNAPGSPKEEGLMTNLDERDKSILRVVWRSYYGGYVVSFRNIEARTGISYANAHYRIHGYAKSGARRREGGLIERGWLLLDEGLGRTLRPGPRFKGLGKDGMIYGDVEWPADPVRVDRREAKWDRRSELVAV